MSRALGDGMPASIIMERPQSSLRDYFEHRSITPVQVCRRRTVEGAARAAKQFAPRLFRIEVAGECVECGLDPFPARRRR